MRIELYKEYVIDELVNNTTFEDDHKWIVFPFNNHRWNTENKVKIVYYTVIKFRNETPYPTFIDHVIEQYGVEKKYGNINMDRVYLNGNAKSKRGMLWIR